MLADCVLVDTAGVGEPDAPAAELVQGELVVARADGLDEAEVGGAGQDVVVPESGDYKNIIVGAGL